MNKLWVMIQELGAVVAAVLFIVGVIILFFGLVKMIFKDGGDYRDW